MLAQTMRRRILLTGGSGVDSTTTAGGFPAGLAGVFAAAGAAGAAGSATANDVSLVGTLSTPMTSPESHGPRILKSHTATPRIAYSYNPPRHRDQKSLRKPSASI